MANHTSSRRSNRRAPTPRQGPRRQRPSGQGARRQGPPWRSGLAPLWREQLARFTRPGWARSSHIRRALAAVLVLLAAVLALRGNPTTADTAAVVAAHDLAPGHVLTDADLRVVARTSQTMPDGALTSGADATGRSLAAAVRSGETLTDVRLLGPALAAAATGSSGATSVPIRLADADAAELLHPGATVDVLALGKKRGDVKTIATGATVLTVQPTDTKRRSEGRLVVLGLPADQATTVAAASLSQSITVTFH